MTTWKKSATMVRFLSSIKISKFFKAVVKLKSSIMSNSKIGTVSTFVLVILLNISTRAQDSTRNNLVHLEGYKTNELGGIPQYKKAGNGEKAIIIIPGLGFDASVFDDF